MSEFCKFLQIVFRQCSVNALINVTKIKLWASPHFFKQEEMTWGVILHFVNNDIFCIKVGRKREQIFFYYKHRGNIISTNGFNLFKPNGLKDDVVDFKK